MPSEEPGAARRLRSYNLALGVAATVLAAGGAAYYVHQREAAPMSGREVYQAYGCAACHGIAGDGRGMQGRGLNPPPTNFRDPASYRNGRDPESLRRAVRLGILEENSRMPAFAHIAPDELDALVGYLTSLQTPENQPPVRAAKDLIGVESAWVRAVPPSSRVTAAYLLIRNDSDKPTGLEGAETGIAASAEIHRMSESGGMMTMEPVSFVPVPARGRAVLEPGGYHLMLIGLKKTLRLGDKVRLTLRFRGKHELAVTATVRETAPDAVGIKP